MRSLPRSAACVALSACAVSVATTSMALFQPTLYPLPLFRHHRVATLWIWMFSLLLRVEQGPTCLRRLRAIPAPSEQFLQNRLRPSSLAAVLLRSGLRLRFFVFAITCKTCVRCILPGSVEW